LTKVQSWNKHYIRERFQILSKWDENETSPWWKKQTELKNNHNMYGNQNWSAWKNDAGKPTFEHPQPTVKQDTKQMNDGPSYIHLTTTQWQFTGKAKYISKQNLGSETIKCVLKQPLVEIFMIYPSVYIFFEQLVDAEMVNPDLPLSFSGIIWYKFSTLVLSLSLEHLLVFLNLWSFRVLMSSFFVKAFDVE